MYSRLVMPGDLNPANRLFGGKMMAWIDEAAALFVMKELGMKSIVTAKISEVAFTTPVKQGDLLDFKADIIKLGESSITIKVSVLINGLVVKEDVEACNCTMVFVHVDSETGKSKPHGFKFKDD